MFRFTFPPYSLVLNPIEDFWTIVELKVKHHALKETETLISRTTKSCEEVPLQHLKNCVELRKLYLLSSWIKNLFDLNLLLTE